MSATRLGALLLAVAVVAVACGAGSGSEAPGNRAGGSGPPLTLRMGTSDAGGIEVDEMDQFARQVADRSGTKIRIETIPGAVDDNPVEWNQVLARKVVDGELDMGLVPARAWDTEGVTTLRALQAPFLVTSDELAAEIAGSDLAGQMLAGLEQDGVVGLALVPEGMRHLFSFGDPILDPADLSGATVRVPKSETSFALFEALGAIPDDLGGPGNRFAAGVASGEVAAAESSFRFATTMPAPATVTGNLTLYPKVDTIVINAAVFGNLTDEQKEMLRSAAGATRDWAVGATTPDATLAQQLCGQEDVRVVAIGEAAAAAFADAARPVYDQLERDQSTAEMIGAIRKTSSQLPPPAPVEPCQPNFDLAPPVEGDPVDLAAFPDGVYRVEISDQDLVAFMPEISQQDIDNNHGIWTWTLSDGRYSIDQRAPGYNWGAAGRFEVSGDRITFYLSWVDDFPATFTWRSDGGRLVFQLVGDLHPILNATFTAHPWKKIG